MTEDTLPQFTIFRASEATDFDASGLMTYNALAEHEEAGSAAAIDAGALEGTTVKLLFAGGGITLAHAWFKSGFPLPRHSHDTGCLYYIVAGTLRLGTETLGRGDGFFVGAGVPYSYVPGDGGVEVLEFRAKIPFDIKLFANNPAFWAKAVATVEGRRQAWRGEVPPSVSN